MEYFSEDEEITLNSSKCISNHRHHRLTSLHGRRKHGHDGDDDGSNDVDDGEEEGHLDGSLKVRHLPAEVGYAEDGDTDGQLQGWPELATYCR